MSTGTLTCVFPQTLAAERRPHGPCALERVLLPQGRCCGSRWSLIGLSAPAVPKEVVPAFTGGESSSHLASVLLGRGKGEAGHDKQPQHAVLLTTCHFWHLKSLTQWPLYSGFSSGISSKLSAGFSSPSVVLSTQ